MHGFGFRLDHQCSAHRAVDRHLKYFFLAGSAFQDGANNLGNHVSGPFYRDPVADPDVLAVNVFYIVEGGLPDGDATHYYRLQNGIWVEAPGAAHVDADIQQSSYRLLRGKLEGDGPSGLPPHYSQGILVGEWVDLYNDTVYLVG